MNSSEPVSIVLAIAHATGWPRAEIMRLSLGETRSILTCIANQDLADRILAVQLAILGRTPFDEKSARALNDLIDRVIPELSSPFQQPAAHEQRAISLLESAGRKIIRKGKTSDG